MTVTVALSAEAIHYLDLSPAQAILESWLTTGAIATCAQQLRFEIDYPREPSDPRELSEIPEVRLWFIRLDAAYPWLPYALDWESGELGRYVAMLVPHQFSTTDGIQYNPEALEIFVMAKVFVLETWMRQNGLAGRNKIKLMTKTLGYEIDDAFFELIGR
ncbi:MAG: CRR6 family NdhI maturation factor [Synechococcales bacterium]|nr:CRR6 family NdhI maturation factor [Synechococcales bacterium]